MLSERRSFTLSTPTEEDGVLNDNGEKCSDCIQEHETICPLTSSYGRSWEFRHVATRFEI